jgi:hypothetical protein
VRRLFAIVAGLLVHATIAMAQVEEVLTFESWAHNGANTNYPGGFRERHMSVYWGGVVGSSSPIYAGSAGILSYSPNTLIRIARTNGTAFDFLGASIARMPTSGEAIKVFGYRACTLVATQIWALPIGSHGSGYVPFTTSLFSNVTEVRFINLTSNAYQCDNIRVAVNPNTGEAIPGLQLQAITYTNQYGVTGWYGVINAGGLIAGREYAFETSTNLVDWEHALPSFWAQATFEAPLYLFLPVRPERFYRIVPD